MIIESLAVRPQAMHQRFWFLHALVGIGLVVFIGRSFYLQVIEGGHFRATAEGNRVTATLIPAPRGIIYDSAGRQLTENIASTDAVLNPTQLPSEENESLLIEILPELLGVTPEEVRQKLLEARQSQRVTRLKAGVSHEQVLALEQRQDELGGVQLASSLVRRYTHPALSHVLGYTSSVSEEELAAQTTLNPTDITGKAGLEKQYDGALRGSAGFSYSEVNAAGRAQKKVEERAPVAGTDLHLTVDLEFQEFIVDVLQRRNEEKKQDGSAAVIALDPRSGAVRALVSYPLFDPNIFSQPSQNSKAVQLIQNEKKPLFNRATDGTYPPGSVIKPLLAASALAEGTITPATAVNSTGGLTIGQWRFPDWKAGGHGTTNLTKAIAESVNTFFYLAIGGDGTTPGLGITRAVEYVSRFGWGQATGIDLPSEASGFLPTPEWKERVKHEAWYIGDTYHFAIGQGDVLVSPLQVAQATATFANGGTLYKPFMVEAAPAGNKLDIAPAHVLAVREAMRATVTEGSGVALRTLPIALAGKTGTAQVGGTEETHAWFTSFGPYESPDLVVTVLLEQGGEGDKDAVPVAREIWDWWTKHRVNK